MLPYETIIAMEAIKRLMNAGYYVTVDYDRGYEASDARNCCSESEISAMLIAMNAVDECWLMVNKDTMTFNRDGEAHGPYDAAAHFIWSNGNEGCDCISDYSDSLCACLDELGETWAYIQLHRAVAALSLIDPVREMLAELDSTGDYANWERVKERLKAAFEPFK